MLDDAIVEIKNKREKDLPTIPFELGTEKNINPFLRADDQKFIDSINLKTINNEKSFTALRLMKDNF